MPIDKHTLTRRDALAALAASGVAVAGGAATLRWDTLHEDATEAISLTGRDVETLNAVAAVVYPSSVSGIPEFVETYTVGRIQDRPGYAAGVVESLARLDDYAEEWYDDRYAALPRETQDGLLREVGVAESDPDPDGIDAERLRHYLVNELLYALYTSPTGGSLVGIENPQGYPGGIDSYQRGPQP